jgi:hypothetical protein
LNVATAGGKSLVKLFLFLVPVAFLQKIVINSNTHALEDWVHPAKDAGRNGQECAMQA